MQFSEMQTRVAAILEDTGNTQWSLTLVKQYINDGLRDFAKRTKAYHKLSSALSASATTPTSAFYTLPTDLLEVEAVHDTVNDVWLERRDVDSLPPSWDTETGTPAWYLFGEFGWTELRVYPYTASALTGLKVYYTALPADLSADADVPTGIPAVYQIALVYFAVAACYRRNFEGQDPAKAAEFQGMYEREVEDAIGRIGRKMSAAPVSVPYRRV